MENAEACATRSPIQTAEKLTPRAHMQEMENSRRHKKQPEEARAELDRNGPKPVGPAHSRPGSTPPLT
jgi:hypothetical protein